MHQRLVRKAVVVLGASTLAVPFLGAVASAASPAQITLAGTKPAWAYPAHSVGTPAARQTITFSVTLPLRNAAGAERLAHAVSDPASAQHGHYLSPAQFNARFAPTKTQVERVSSYLTGQGFTVTGVPANRRWVSASGTVAQVDAAFHTTLRTYEYRGHRLKSPSSPVSVPASIRPDILTVTGLDDSTTLRRPLHHVRATQAPRARARSSAGTPQLPTPSQCSNFYGQHQQTVPSAYGRTQWPTYLCGYIPDQLQSAYGTKSAIAQGRDGSGITVAITDAYASSTMESDANRYSQLVGLPTFAAGQYSETVSRPFDMQSECGGEAGWNGEETLDVEAVHGMAPGAKILYVGARDCDQGLDEALNTIVNGHLADIVSDSWGNLGEDIPASEIQKEHTIFVQAAAEGIGVYFSSGDYGDEVINTGVQQPDYPASDPYVTAVGGTSLAVDSAGKYSFETGWGTDLDRVAFDSTTGAETGYQNPLPGPYQYGAGGGTSTVFTQPSYQRRVVPTSLSEKYGNQPMRVVPDVAAVADPYTGFLVGQTENGTFGTYAIGGTSLACPVFAGIQALASQGRATPIGFANPTLYKAAGTGAYRDVVPTRGQRAITNPSGSYLVTLDHDSSLRTTRGYDDVTGMGSPVGSALFSAESGSGGHGGGHGGHGGGHGHHGHHGHHGRR